MPFIIKKLQMSHLKLLTKCNSTDLITLCKLSFDYLVNGQEKQDIYEAIASKYDKFNTETVQVAVETLISILVDAVKANADKNKVKNVLCLSDFKEDAIDILTQFVISKRIFMEGSIRTANIRAYRLVNIEWRLEMKLSSRSIMKHSGVSVTLKLYLHTEPKNENRNFLECTNAIYENEKRNRKDLVVQTDLNSLNYMIYTLEKSLLESRSRRVRNFIDAIP